MAEGEKNKNLPIQTSRPPLPNDLGYTSTEEERALRRAEVAASFFDARYKSEVTDAERARIRELVQQEGWSKEAIAAQIDHERRNPRQAETPPAEPPRTAPPPETRKFKSHAREPQPPIHPIRRHRRKGGFHKPR
jgi:hypothetical protein